MKKKGFGLDVIQLNFFRAKISLLITLLGGRLSVLLFLILSKDPISVFLVFNVDAADQDLLYCTKNRDQDVGFKPNVVVKYPMLLNLSVEKRIRPRYKVFQYLNLLGARHDHAMCLLTSLIISEEHFTQRFLSDSPELKRFYQKYKGETAGVEVCELLPTH